eukprot:gene32725-42376_t
MGYVTYITMWSLFRIRLVGTMELVPHRTHPKSLSFNVRMIARLFGDEIISAEQLKEGQRQLQRQHPSKPVLSSGTVLDLRNILHLKLAESKLKLEIDYGDDTFKLKFKSLEEVRRWHQLLEKWKDFFTDYAHIHPVDIVTNDKNEKNEFEATNPLVQGEVEVHLDLEMGCCSPPPHSYKSMKGSGSALQAFTKGLSLSMRPMRSSYTAANIGIKNLMKNSIVALFWLLLTVIRVQQTIALSTTSWSPTSSASYVLSSLPTMGPSVNPSTSYVPQSFKPTTLRPSSLGPTFKPSDRKTLAPSAKPTT